MFCPQQPLKGLVDLLQGSLVLGVLLPDSANA